MNSPSRRLLLVATNQADRLPRNQSLPSFTLASSSKARRGPRRSAAQLALASVLSAALVLWLYTQLRFVGAEYSAGAASLPRPVERSAGGDDVPPPVQAVQQPVQPVQPVQPPPGGFPAANATRLVLVAGHSVFVGVDYKVAAREDAWYLEPYQQA